MQPSRYCKRSESLGVKAIVTGNRMRLAKVDRQGESNVLEAGLYQDGGSSQLRKITSNRVFMATVLRRACHAAVNEKKDGFENHPF
ncbi:hypothetical protein [Planctomycetes bacterium CA13]|uniref:hypothetical protein n=1 Tax=Novipirellula herctigrandis TaxID=2527986 RepID=UPI0011B79B0C